MDIVNVVRVESEKKGLKMNVKKIKTMLVSRDHDRDKRIGIGRELNIFVKGQKLEQVKKFKYLRQWITDDGRSDFEVKSRIEMARSSFIKLKDFSRFSLEDL